MDWPVAGGYAAAFFLTLGYLAVSGPAELPAAPPSGHHASSGTEKSAPPAAAASGQAATPPSNASATAAVAAEWTVPDIDKLPDDPWGKLVRQGRDLTVETYAHLGPEVSDAAMRFTGTNMACQSCHLEAGTKQYGLPFVGVFGDFPQYRAREGAVGTIEDRVNGCMTRSMNGKELPLDSQPMRAFVAYIKFLSDKRPIGAKTPGRGSGQIAELSRPADPAKGEGIYGQHCAVCHGADGLGKRAGAVGDGKGYEFPPLWGDGSFNDGAGMGRLISAANFIRSNMPNGTTHDSPVLTVEEAWDVAAYMESKRRPHKADLDKDFPVRTEKPADAAYGPFADGMPAEQHKYGPFQPIRDKLKELKAQTIKQN